MAACDQLQGDEGKGSAPQIAILSGVSKARAAGAQSWPSSQTLEKILLNVEADRF
jgi:hypothetical protein